MQFEEAFRYLLSLGHETLAMKLGLKTTELLLAALENPQSYFPAVQIAGTNGKGSTAVVLDSICRAARIKTGLFTSPHLVSPTERIKIAGQDLSEPVFADLATTVRETADNLIATNQLTAPPTFFEQITAIALLAFRQKKIELAILETGLGGRLDSTSVAGAQTIALTPIALDHQEYLGNTLAEIAAEKAAIIRPGATAVIASQAPAALTVIRQRCESVGVVPFIDGGHARVLATGRDGRILATLKTSRDTYEEVRPGLRGRHQLINALLAIQLAESLRERGFRISHAAIIEGVERASHPGRLELVESVPQVLFDGAHNPAGALALADYLNEFVSQPITLVFGAMRDKNLEEMARLLFSRAHRLILTKPQSARAADEQILRRIAAETIGLEKVMVEPSAKKAMLIALEQTASEGLVCVTGSLYLIGEIQGALFR